jgi:tetratricopeptide (TPR) repeat protein
MENDKQIHIPEALQSAILLFQAGKLQQAEQICQQVLALDPDNENAHNVLGIIAFQTEDFAKAVEHLARTAAINPRQPAYFNNLGNAYKKLGRLDEAVASYNKALALKPDYAEAFNNLGVSQKELGNLEDAVASYEQALRFRPNYADAYFNLGNALQAQNELDRAIDSYKQALNINPNNAETLYSLGNALHAKDRYDNAIAVYKLALRVKPDYVDAFVKMGNAELRLGNLDTATDLYDKALGLAPDNAEAYFGLGNVNREKGGLRRAEELFKKVLQLKPEFSAAHCQLAFTRRHTEYDADIKAMLMLMAAENRADKDKANLNFGLGKAFEDLKQYEKAFSYILEGNRLKRKTYDYDISEDRQLFARIKEVFSKEFFAEFASAGCHDETPVFILGMPRSGTTLLEQILSSHPQVHGAGELHYIQSMIQHFCCSEDNKEYPDCMSRLARNDYAEMGEDYVKKLRQQHSENGNARYIINKMPHNFLHAGFIKLILPRARIIHSRRSPMDTCLSIFKNLFAGTHRYAYDLQELGEYYRLYEDLMAHWRSVLPGSIFEVQYEEMVGDQENQTRRLLEFCGLEWDDACLSFHKSSRTVSTASVVQVRQPIYKSSVQLWKRYEKELEPLLRALDREE